MKHFIIAALLTMPAGASTVNPASNVTADSANTPGTIVLRDAATGSADITLAAGNVDTAKIAADAVTAVKILNGVIDSSKLAAGSVDTGRLGTDSVTAASILNGTISTADIANSAVDTNKIAASAVNTSKIGTPTNDSGKILASCGGTAMWRIGGTCP